ncbi:hypothetical protein PAECIP111893_03198 [Paenibacillus plantiphilus]|uniref:Lipoprotein n=1 Tax=Paenibacillus plantiphilus TaxID=2905650 RepID=A0ABN8GJ33_9BACL|nr:hypothetical protein [Paenibacillus plantiphilus]CAH1210319.1 hypothetical protein PAECIP111893_03198 [Paenibacillus plantiphilus]
MKLIIAVALAASLLTSCSQTDETDNRDQNYFHIMQLIDQGQLKQAQPKLIELPDDYKESRILKIYVDTKLAFEAAASANYANYAPTLTLFKALPSNYEGTYQDLISQLYIDLQATIGELELQQIAAYVKERKFLEAKNVINSSIFEDAAYPIISQYLEIAGYKPDYANRIKINKALFVNIPEDYKGVFSKEINELRQKAIDYIVQTIKDKKYIKVREDTIIIGASKDITNPTYNALQNYAAAKYFEEEQSEEAIILSIARIEANYDGPFAAEIKSIQKKYRSDVNKIREQENRFRNMEIIKKDDPQIGMTAQEVENSTWGAPDRIHTTESKYGTREQWAYDNRGYIYFEDGVVSTIRSRTK